MKKTKTVKKVKNETKDDFLVSFKVFGKTYTSKGETLKEAVEALDYTGKVAGISIFTVARGEVKKERIMNPVIANRLFSQSRIMREIAIKNILTLFDNFN